MNSRRAQRPMRQTPGVSGQPAAIQEVAATEIDVILAEIDGLQQGLLGLRLQQQEADANLRQINDRIQQQIGGIAVAQRLLQSLQGMQEGRDEPPVPVPAPAENEGGAE